jgi:ankyrin repeat protein
MKTADYDGKIFQEFQKMNKPYYLIIMICIIFPLFAGGQPEEAETPSEPLVFNYIERGDMEGLKKYLLSDSPVVNSPKSSGNYPLHSAVEKNNFSMAQILLTSGASIDETNALGETPLVMAAKKDNRELVDLFLKWDGDPMIKDGTGSYALHYGVINNSDTIVKELVPVMTDVNITDGEGRSALQIAVEEGYREIATYLISKGGDIYLTAANGSNAADLVIEKQDTALLKSVITRKNYIESYDKAYPLLHRSVEKGNLAFCEYLMGLDGGGLNINDAENRIPLDIALGFKRSYDHARIAEYLIESGSKRSSFKEFSYVSSLFKNDDIDLDLGQGMTPLHQASLLGHEGLVELMIRKYSPNLDKKDSVGGTPLLYTVRGGHESIAEILIDGGANVNSPDNFEQTPVQAAIGLVNYKTMLDLLVIRGGNINQQDIHGNTALHLAVQYGLTLDVIKTLITLGNDPNIRNSEGSIPLIYALTSNREDLISYLTPLSDIFAVNQNNQSSVLLAMSGDMALMESFFTPSNLTLQDVEGNSALHYAATYPLDELTREKMIFMVNRGADPNVRNARGMTPLHSAIESFYWKTANTLISLGSDMYLSNNAGETALHMAFVRGSDFSMRFLTDGDNLLEESDLAGDSPLFHAIREFHLPLIGLLIKGGADINHLNNLGQTPIFAAVEENFLEAVELLLESGVTLMVKDSGGNTPMHFLVSKKEVNYLVGDLLLEGGLSLDSKNNKNMTPLHRGAESGSLSGCTFLLERGAKIDPVDNNGFTPLFYSIMNGSTKLVTYLLEQGSGINKRDIRGNTVLHAAVLQAKDQNKGDLINLLLDWGGDIFAKNKIGDTPLSLAMEVGPVTLDYILREDTVNSINNEGNTPLHYALMSKSDPAIIEILLSEGADKDSINGNGEKPVKVARDMGYDPYIIKLLEEE